MIQGLTHSLDFHGTALLLRSERGRVLAGNIANADTPHFKARDFDFRTALASATGVQMRSAGGVVAMPALPQVRTAAAHLGPAAVAGATPPLLYRAPLQTAIDGNTVDMDMERANFADNTLRYEASLRFINGQIRTMLTAINGQ